MIPASVGVIERFHRLYYNRKLWQDTHWQGVSVAKNPMDLWQYAEIIHETKPELIVETGSYRGGSALFFASLFNMIGAGQVISIDIEPFPRPQHSRITWATGSSADPDAIAYVTERATNLRTMVILDSDHHKRHVLRELDGYAPLVTPGCYLVVEDTNVNGNPVEDKHGAGPAEALKQWLPDHPEFEVDLHRERFLLTFNASGWLRRVSSNDDVRVEEAG